MRRGKCYWLWGLFPSKDKFFLNKIKTEVQSKFESPYFETHITLTGPYFRIDDFFFKKLKNFSENNSAIMLDPIEYNVKQEKYESFFISIKNSSGLKELRRKIYELNYFDINKNYYPHISLSYGNHEINEKIDLISKLPKLNQPIKMSKIALVEVDEDINLWKIQKTFDLNNGFSKDTIQYS